MNRTANRMLLSLVAVTITVVLAGSSFAQDGVSVTANLEAKNDSGVSGQVVFTQQADGVHISGTFSGLTPGNHGFHIHQYGDCSATDGTSAGGHFNPHAADHGSPDAEMRHAGDLGNVEADSEGNASVDRVDAHLTFEGPGSIVGRGLIVHAGEDDLTSQPTGAAGPRVACGVIGWSASE